MIQFQRSKCSSLYLCFSSILPIVIVKPLKRSDVRICEDSICLLTPNIQMSFCERVSQSEGI